MKYVIFKSKEYYYPALLPDACQHSELKLQGATPVAAGSCTLVDGGFLEVSKDTESRTLNLLPGSDDSRFLNALLYDAPGSAYMDYEARKPDDLKSGNYLADTGLEIILCAAIWVNDGQRYAFQPPNIGTGKVYCGLRHPAIIEQLRTERMVYPMTQGFLTSKNRFLDRDQAHVLAKDNGQLTKDLIGSCFTSEDLW